MKETINFLNQVTKVKRFCFWFRAHDGQALGMQVVWQELTSCLLGSLESRCLYILFVKFTEKVLSYPSISCGNISICVLFEHWESFFLEGHDNAKAETWGSFIT